MAERDNVITIKVNEHGDFTYDPSVKHVKPGETITWTSTQGPFAICFKDRTPFDHLNHHAIRGAESNSWAVSSRPMRVTKSGHFHYAVAIYADGKVFLDAGCPEIIVNFAGN